MLLLMGFANKGQKKFFASWASSFCLVFHAFERGAHV
jgi:hypothetical protein